MASEFAGGILRIEREKIERLWYSNFKASFSPNYYPEKSRDMKTYSNYADVLQDHLGRIKSQGKTNERHKQNKQRDKGGMFFTFHPVRRR